MLLTRPQREAVWKLYLRTVKTIPLAQTYRQFRKTAEKGCDCLMVPMFGMWVGIEEDGYTHS